MIYLANIRWRRLAVPLGLVAGLLALAYANGWRPPGIDRHPFWAKFPHLTNPRLVVEEIPDFEARYGRRYRLPAAAVAAADPVVVSRFEAYYRANLRNVRRLGSRSTGNGFSWGGRGLSLGGNERGPAQHLEPPHFRPRGYEYLALELAGTTGYFKGEVYEEDTFLPSFYQYNYPAAATDTLFLRSFSRNYRVYVRVNFP